MKTALAGAAVLGVLLAALTALPASGGPPLVGSTHYLVQPDPRLCPSPLCGGYWVSLANRGRTRCHDGALRPRCYVFMAVDEERHRLTSELPADALARAAIEPWSVEGFGKLGVLVVADLFSPAGRAPVSGTFYRVVDTGIRCVRAPCFSWRASRLNESARVTASDLDLAAARAAPGELDRAEVALRTKNGLLARGRIVPTAEGGRLLRVWRIYLRITTPRA